MLKEKSPIDIYEELSVEGLYEEANLDKDETEKRKKLILEDYEYGKKLKKMQDPNWRVIFNINYDAIRELCEILMLFKKQKISNHQGLFAFIVLNFKELELDWNFFELIRNMRNNNKYKGVDITKEMWKNVELRIDLHISAIKQEVEKRLNELR